MVEDRRRRKAAAEKSTRVVLCIALVIGFSCAASGAQDAYSIRVEPHQVVVPAFVFVRDVMTRLSQKEWNCSLGNAETFYKLRLSDPYKPAVCDETTMRDLTAADFRLFEDGAEQKIQDVALQRVPLVHVRDSSGWHDEFSGTPIGRWSTIDLGPLMVPGDTGYRDSTGWHPGFYYVPKQSWSSSTPRYLPGDAGYFYRIAYVPPTSEEGSCHHVRVDVARPNAVVFARSEYCNVRHAPSDRLLGTRLGEILLSDASSGRKGKLQIWMQTVPFRTDSHNGRVDIALAFRWYELHREWQQGRLVANVGLLGLVYDLQGNQVMRFSDFGCCSDDRPDFMRGKHANDADPQRDPTLLPTRYEAQIELPAGDYKLRVVLGDGNSFGVAESLFSIEPYDAKALTLSSLILSDRFRDVHAAKLEDDAASLAPLYLPLVSKGAQFYPSADPRKHFGQRLFVYFDVEEGMDLDASTKVRMQMKVLRARHGEVEVDTGLKDLTSWFAPESAVAHVVEEIKVDDMRPGWYRVEVQASDSAGRTSVVRSANFQVE